MPIIKCFSEFPLYIDSFSPFPVGILKEGKWKSFIQRNGFVSLARKLYLKVFTQIPDAQNLWQQYAPDFSVFDLWDTRLSFYEGLKFDPYFLTIIKEVNGKQNILGTLPLWLDLDKKPPQYRFFGSNWPEDNTFFVKDPDIIPLLLIAAPSPLKICCIKQTPDIDFLRDLKGYGKEDEPKYFLNLENFNNLEDFLAILKKKKRYNLKRDHKKISHFNPQVLYDDPKHLEILFNLNIRRFKDGKDASPDNRSNFEDERWKEVHRKLVTNAGAYQTRLISTVINGRVEAVELALIYNKTYYALNSGANTFQYSGLGVFSNLLLIKDAIDQGCTKIDFLEGSNHWKESWHLSTEWQYMFEK